MFAVPADPLGPPPPGPPDAVAAPPPPALVVGVPLIELATPDPPLALDPPAVPPTEPYHHRLRLNHQVKIELLHHLSFP